MKLESITRSRRIMPRRIMLYGVHGIGKSTFAAAAPAPVFISTEGGIDGIDVATFPRCERMHQVIDAIGTLYEGGHDFKTVVIDSLDWLEPMVWRKVCADKGVKCIEDIAYAKGYVLALNEWKEIIAGLDALREQRGMHVIVIAHAAIKRFENPETDTYDRYMPKMHDKASALWMEWADEVMFANYQVFTRSTDEGFNQKRVVAVGSGNRILRTTERPAHMAKNRLGLPDEIPLDWNEYAKFLTPAGNVPAAINPNAGKE